MTGRQKAWLITRIVLKRLRFIAILAAVAGWIYYWDTIKNYWDKWTRPQAAASRQLVPSEEFFCPMDPQVIRSGYESNGDVPKCPICGMPLSIRKKADAVPLPPGVTGRVQLTPERVQLAGIQTVPVELRRLNKRITTVGNVTFDESRLSRVVSRVSGYVEKLYVETTFAEVHKGDRLAEVYSPDLYTTAQTLLLDAKTSGRPGLLASTRERLELLGVSPEDIDAVVASGKASPRLLIRSPRSGYVIEKRVVAGSSVEPGMTLLEVADLSAVWVEADVYEKDISFLQPGQAADATVEAIPNHPFHGKLALVYPRLDTATRTNRVRIELDNAGHELRPGMFATVTIDVPLESVEPFKSLAARSPHPKLSANDDSPLPSAGEGSGVRVAADKEATVRFPVVPERAVVDSGTKKVVYVEREPGLFEGAEVELGPRVDLVEGGRTVDYYPVLKGLAPGDRVAAAGAFLIDAETRLNPAAAASYFGASGGPQSGASGGAHPIPLPKGEGTGAKAVPKGEGTAEPTGEALAQIDKLPEADRKLALAQRVCPITGAVLGSMGVPVKIVLNGQPVFLCCAGCEAAARENPEKTLKKVAELKAGAH